MRPLGGLGVNFTFTMRLKMFSTSVKVYLR